MIACPDCSSENVQKASVIYEHGTSDIHVSTAGGGASWGSLGGGGAYSRGVSQSKLASKMAPPRKKSFWFTLFILFWPRFFLWVGFTAAQATNSFIYQIIHWGFIALVIYLFIRIRKYNKEVWPKYMVEYDRAYFCHKCGQIFHITEKKVDTLIPEAAVPV